MRVRTPVAALVVAVLAGLALAPASTADPDPGDRFCDGTFTPTGAHDGPSGRCTTAFRGFPIGTIGRYEAMTVDGTPDPAAPAEIHVEVWLRLANGTRQRYAECFDGDTGVPGGVARFGTAECSAEGNGAAGRPLSAPVVPPSAIVHVECLAHSHARVVAGTTPMARFGCYSTDAAEAALRAHMGMPGEPDPEPEPEPLPVTAPVDPPSGPPAVITSVVPNTYETSHVFVTPGSDVRYVNLDSGTWHDVVAFGATRQAGSAPWCSDPRFYAGCPLFYTDLIEGGPGSSVRVEGLAGAAPGEYTFHCTLHSDMEGTITVVDA